MKISTGSKRQREIYLNGFSGLKSKTPFHFEELEKAAKSKLSKKAFGYIYTGAGTNQGIQNNIVAFNKYAIIPNQLSGISEPQLDSTLLNTKLPFPFLFAPIGVLELAHKNGDLELAEASKITSVPMIQSCQASHSMESISRVMDNTQHWFQLYFGKSRDLVESMVHRAEISGNNAIVLTLDTTQLGWRNMDLQNGFLPFLSGLGIAQYTSDPVFKKLMNTSLGETPVTKFSGSINLANIIKLFHSYPDSFLRNIITKNPIKAVRTFSNIFSNPELNWDDVKWLKSITRLPILLKGIVHPDDARKAIDLGMDGLIISNHGGRQVDQVISTLDALIEIKKVVHKDYPLLLDSGIRKAADIYIAIALGAKAVCIGRPYVYALATGGRSAVVELIQNLASELMITMTLTGCKSLEEFSDHVRLK